jgi:hypothetical protein
MHPIAAIRRMLPFQPLDLPPAQLQKFSSFRLCQFSIHRVLHYLHPL